MGKRVHLLVICWLILSLFLTGFVILLTNNVEADQEGDYTYDVGGAPLVATIVHYQGTGGAISIPSTLGGYPVKEISGFAFADCNSLTSVTIPENVTHIGPCAFRNCDAMSTIDVSASNPNYTSVDGVLYNKTMIDLIQCPGGKLTVNIPVSVVSIDDYAFFGCSKLSSVTGGSGVTSIGVDAFGFCSALTSFTIPDKVTSIGYFAFSCCSSLTQITVPDGVTTILNSTFSYCTNLKSVTLGSGVTMLWEYCFGYCTNLTSMTFYGNAPSFWSSWIHGCSPGLTFYYQEGATGFNEGWWAGLHCSMISAASDFQYSNNGVEVQILSYNGAGGDVIIPSLIENVPVTCLGNYSFQNCGSLTSIVIPDTVTNIGNGSFYYCTALKSVTISNDDTLIGDYAFYDCSSLISLNLPSNVTHIGYDEFGYCSSLTSITIPNNVTSIERYGFENCWSLTSVMMGDNVTSIGNFAFGWCSSLKSISISSNLTNIGDNAFFDCSSLTGLIVPGKVASIGGVPFWGCSSLTSISVDPNNLFFTSVDGVLCNKTITTLIECPWGKSGAFVVPNSVTCIGDSAFDDCSHLTSVVMSNNVTIIGNSAFNGCSSLTSITMSKNVTSIGSYAFVWCSQLDSIVIPSKVSTIGDYAFIWCAHLTSIMVPTSVTSLGIAPFSECSALTSIGVDPNNLFFTSVDGLLYNKAMTTIIDCPGGKIGSFVIPDGVTSIGDHAFEGCALLTSVTIPISISHIGESALGACPALTRIVFNGSAPTCGSSWIQGNAGLIIFYYSRSTGFSTPYWQGIPTEEIFPVPSAARNLMAMLGIGYVNLTWAIPLNNGEAPIDYYVVYEDGVDVRHVIATSVTITGLTSGQTYTFEIAAHNSNGVGPDSNHVSEKMPTAPSAPQDLVSVAGNRSVSLSWTTPSNNGELPIDYYVVFENALDVRHVTSNSTIFTGLTNGQSYGFSVAAHNAAGIGIATSFINVTPATVPDVPTGLTADVGDSQVTLNWTAPEGNGGASLDYYIIYQDGVDVKHISSINATITGLTNGQSYRIWLAAHNAVGNGTETTTVTVVPVANISLAILVYSPIGRGISTSPVINVTFSEAMNESTTSIKINGVIESLSWRNNSTCFISPSLAYNMTYFVNVKGKDLAGNSVEFSWSFITMKDEGVIEGVIKDASGNPIADAKIILSNGMRTMTNATGYFFFSNVTSGTYNLIVEKDGYQTIMQSVSTAAGLTDDLGLLSIQANTSVPDSGPIVFTIIAIIVVLTVTLIVVRKRKGKRGL